MTRLQVCLATRRVQQGLHFTGKRETFQNLTFYFGILNFIILNNSFTGHLREAESK